MKTVLPMGVENVPALIDRTYRNSHAYQWVREALINSKEAGAVRVHFGIEWQGVETRGVYRRLILDDGRGMNPDEMLRFLNTYGGSGKPIGGVHENFGHGFKTSTLPWNHQGIVVVSRSRDGLAMVRLQYDPKAEEYGAKFEDVGGFREAVYQPYDATATDGVDYRTLIPDEWETGVAILLLGSDHQPDTILGAPDRPEADLNGIAQYVNTRMWDLEGLHVTVDYFNNSNRALWPKSFNDRDLPNTSSKKWASRRLYGAKYHIELKQKDGGEVAHRGSVQVGSGLAKVHWYLRSGTPTQSSSVAEYRGYIAYLYKNELYTLQNHPSTFRAFGIPAWLKQNVFLIIEPREFDGTSGAYANDARTQLLLGGSEAGRALPNPDWSSEFANDLPPAIQKKIAEHLEDRNGTIRDEKWKTRLSERFGHLWKIIKPIVTREGPIMIEPVQPIRQRGEGTGGSGGDVRESSERTRSMTGFAGSGSVPAVERKVAGGLPDYRAASKDEFDEPWILATWEPPSSTNEHQGVVLVNIDHPVIKKHIAETQRMFAANEDTVAQEVVDVYGELAVAHVAHSEEMRKLMSVTEVNGGLRSDAALTMALLGMWQVDAILLPRLSGKMAKRRIAS